MDSITQATLGGLCGEMTLRKQLGWKGMAWGLLIGTLPDLDIIVYPWLDKIEKLSWHRGISHSILMCFVAALTLGWLLAKIHHKKGVTQKQATWFVFITWFTHVTIDCFTSYGTQIFEPFHNHRFAFNNMSIIDISFTLPMLTGLLLVLFFRKTSYRRTIIGRVVAIWLCLYTAASFVLKYQANAYFEKNLQAHGITPTRMMTAPTLSNILLWRMLAESQGQYHIAYWSVLDAPTRPYRIDSTPKGHQSLEPIKHHPEAIQLVWFTKGWHKVIEDPKKRNSPLLVDMRFTEMVTPERKSPIFTWRLTQQGNKLDFNQVSFREKSNAGETLDYLWQRIQGNAPEWMNGSWPWYEKSIPKTQ
ncbi:MAG: metal-dependent hydrolase [Akkermansiaceae bacterium]